VVTAVYPVSAARAMPVGLGRWLWFVVAFAVLGVVVPTLAVAQVPDAGRSGAWRIAVLVAAWAGFRLAILIGAGEPRFFAFFFWLFTYLFMGVAPVVQIRADRPSTTTPDVLPGLDAITLWTVVLGLVCFEIGSLLSRARTSRSASSLPEVTGVKPRVAVGFVLAGSLVSGYYLSRVGLTPLLTSRDAVAAVRAEVWPDIPTRAAVLNLALYLTLMGVGAVRQLLGSERRALPRLGYVTLAVVGLAALSLVAFPLSTPRFTLGTLLFALLVLLGGAAHAGRVRLTLVVTVFSLFFVFPIADAFRRTGDPNFARAGLFGEYAGNPDYDALWQVANASNYWASGAAGVGRQALGVVLFWLPRSVWPDKPLDTGAQLALLHNYSTQNLSAPLWAEALANGGLIAVVLVFVALGLLVNTLDRAVVRSARTGGLWVVAGAVLPAYFVIVLRGSLLQATGTLAIMVLSLLALRQRLPPPVPTAPASRSATL